jgi:pimeloyl-ACP methyl ester carboxylesterase
MPFTYRFGWKNYSKFPITAYLGGTYCNIQANYLPWLSVFQSWAKSDRKIISQLKHEYREDTQEAFRQGIKGPVQDLILYTSNWGFKVKDIKTKLFLWYGQDDKNVTLAMGKYYASQIKNSVLKVYPNEGHTVSVTHAKEIFDTLVR